MKTAGRTAFAQNLPPRRNAPFKGTMRHHAREFPHSLSPELPFDVIATKVDLEPKVPVTALCANVGHQ
jgi:hypothetical protein